MNFEEMKALEPELSRLEASAENAGRHGADWWSVLLAVNEPLSKLTGRGAAREELQSARAYEVCRAALFEAWSKGEKAASPAVATEPDGQQAFIPTSEAYR